MSDRVQGIHSQGKSQGKYFFKVREVSGNFVISQGILDLSIKSGKSSGNFEITSQGKVRQLLAHLSHW